ncbi:MAG: AAA family ATPase [Chloroflexia bacterium]
MLTLTGPGGTGKTRVALHAAELMHEFTDGVYFVNLAPVSDPDLVSAAVAAVLNVQESAERNLLDSLSDWLRPRRAALLLDNFEHVLGAAPIVASLVRAAPGLKVLATSRAPLCISGEHEYPIHPLETPDPSRITTVESLLQNDAVALFVARAKAVKPGFELMHENAYAAAAICVSLDGLPLAIELAAARVRMFAPQAMLSRLTNRLKLLTGGARDLPTRQQTLRGAIDWSTVCSQKRNSNCLRDSRCSQARAPWNPPRPCKPDDDSDLDVIEGLDSLVNNSLLRQEESDDGEPSFAMLQTIREYAADRLAESGEGESVRRLHAEHQLWLAETARPELVGPDQREWIRKLELAGDELRTALSWATSGGDSRLALRFGAALWRFWDGAGQYTEGREWLHAALSSADGDSTPRWRRH